MHTFLGWLPGHLLICFTGQMADALGLLNVFEVLLLILNGITEGHVDAICTCQHHNLI